MAAFGSPALLARRQPLGGAQVRTMTIGSPRTWLSLGLAAFALLATAASAPAEEILVFAAASTTDALEQIGQEFQHQTGNRVAFSFGASSMLARQILAGAPADLFLSADSVLMQELVKAGLVRAGEVRNLLSNQLVVVVPLHSKLHINSAADLESAKSIAAADPEAVPAGVYARQWLESKRVWSRLQPSIMPALDVRAALAAVATGVADAAVVYRTDAAISPRVRVAYAVPLKDGPRILYPVAKIAGSTRPAAAAFVNFLASASARAVFERFGFLVL